MIWVKALSKHPELFIWGMRHRGGVEVYVESHGRRTAMAEIIVNPSHHWNGFAQECAEPTDQGFFYF